MANRSEESIMRDKALVLYRQSFHDEELPCNMQMIQDFLDMWCTSIPEAIVMCPRPPCGWAEFNLRLGGVPWGGAYSSRPERSLASVNYK